MANYLIDIDGTICEDLKNEESHRYPDAVPYENAAMYLTKLADDGHKITYFTSREEKDREATLLWLRRHGFPIHGLIMNKPRGGRYVWIDNLDPKTVCFRGQEWNEPIFQNIVSIAEELRGAEHGERS